MQREEIGVRRVLENLEVILRQTIHIGVEDFFLHAPRKHTRVLGVLSQERARLLRLGLLRLVTLGGIEVHKIQLGKEFDAVLFHQAQMLAKLFGLRNGQVDDVHAMLLEDLEVFL